MKKIFAALTLMLLPLIAACGGGGGSGAAVSPTTAVIKVSTQGIMPAGKALSGFGMTLELPTGVTAKTVAGGAIDTTVVVNSGLLASSAGTMGPVTYTPATATTRAKIDFYIASLAPAGVGVGEYATINLMLAGVNPTITDFNVIAFTPVDLSYAPLPALTAKLDLTVF